MNEKNFKQFSEQSGKYLNDSYWRQDEEYLVNKYFEISKGKRLLILGCGAGRTIKPLYDKGFEITAIDIVPEMVAAAKQRMAGASVDIREMDAVNLDFTENSFDYAFFPFHGIDNVYKDIDKFLSGLARVLKPGGIFLYNSHNRTFLKLIHKIHKKYANYGGFEQYRSSPLDKIRLKRYFKEVGFKYRISMHRNDNWKDRCYKILPFFDRSIYFICQLPKKL